MHDRSLTISRRLAALLPLLCALIALAVPAHAQTSSVPTFVRVGIGNGSLTLYWQAAANATSYNIYRGTTAGGESATAIATGITAYNGNAYYYTDSSVTNGTKYYYEVTANTFNGESADSAEVSGTPGAPVLPAPVLTGTPGNGQVVLNWNAIPGATSYELYKYNFSNNQYFAYAFGISGTTYTDKGLANGTTYQYFVAAIDADGSGTGSNGVAVTPGEVVPPAPTGIVVYTVSGNFLRIAWNAVAGATGYNIYRGTSPGGEGATPYSTGATSYYNNGYTYYFDDHNVTTGTTYYYFVTAKNGVGESAHSIEASGLLNAATAAAPSLTATTVASPASVTLHWNAVTGAAGYDIYKAVAGTGNYVEIARSTGTSYTDTAVTAGVSYSYVIAYYTGSYDESGGGSNTVTATPGGAAPRNPTGLAAYPGNGITLTWNPVQGASSYNIYRGTSSKHEAANPIATNVTAFNGTVYYFYDTTGTSGTTYYYFVTANNSNGESIGSNEASATVGGTVIAAPVLLIAPNGSNQPVLTWNAIPGATSYNIYRSFGGQPFQERITTTTATTATDTGINLGIPVTYYVCAVGVSGQSAASNQVTFTPGQPAPPAPSGLTASLYTGTQISLTWIPVPGATSYNVYEGTASGGENATPVLTGVTNPNNLIVGGLTSGTTYYFKVSALSNAGASALSNEASATPGTAALAAPALVVTTPSTTEADLSWNAVTGATSYIVYRSVGVTNSFAYYRSLTTTSTKDTGLTPGVTYAYYVVAVSKDAAGNPSNTVVVLPGGAGLPAPAAIATPYSSTDIEVVWNAVPGATSYNVYRGTSAGGESAVPIATGVTSPSGLSYYFIDTTTVSGTRYYYKVTAVDAIAESPKSGEVSATAGAGTLPAPTLHVTDSVSGGVGQAVLTWTTVSGATGYTIYVNIAGAGFQSIGSATSATFTQGSLTPGVQYIYYVAPVNAAGQGGGSNQVSVTPGSQIPPAPIGLVVQPYGAADAILSWNYVTGASSYNVYRGTSAGGEASIPVAVGITNPNGYVDSNGTIAGTKYYYTVTAVNSGGESGKSNEASVLTGSAILAAPSLSASSTSGSVSLTWSAVAGATVYNIYRSVTGPGSLEFLKSVTTVSTSDSPVTNGLTYTYQVYAANASGYGSPSNVVNVVPGGVAPPAPPGLTALQEGYYIQLNWNPVPGITNYNIYRSTSPGGEGATPIATNAGNGYGVFYYYNDSNVTAGTKYYYQVTAVSSVGEGAKSNEASAVDGTSPLGVPSVSGVPGNTQVVLNWSAVSGATSYDVYQSTIGTASSSFLYVANTAATTYTVTGLTNGVPYSYSIVAVGASGRAPSGSNPVTVVPGTTTGLPAPTGLAVTNNGQGNLALTWNAVIGATYYSVYRATQSGKEGSAPIAAGVTSNLYTDSNVTPGITYFYQVTASNNFTESAKSNEASAADAESAPAAPVLQVKAGGTSAILTWNTVTGATGYNVYQSIEGASYRLIAGTTNPTYTNSGLASGITYSYYVTAVGSGGQSGNSNTATLTIGATVLPAPTGLYVYPYSNYFVIEWNTVPGATSYNIYRGTSPGGEGAVPYAVGATGTTNGGMLTYFNDGSLTSRTTYYYFVTATNAAGESGHSNEASATYGLGELPAPNLTGKASGGTIVLNWSAVPGATSYDLFRSVGAAGNYMLYKSVTATTYTDTAVISGIAYSYIVCAVNVNNHGANSNTVSLFSSGSVLSAPFGLVASSSGASNIYLQWDFVGGASSYNVYRGTTPGGESAKPIITGATFYYNNGFGNIIDTTTVSGTTYYYRVSAVNGTGESGTSGEASATAGSAPLPAPVLSGALGTAGSGTIVLNWTAVPGATSYDLFRGFVGSPITLYKGGLTGTTYTDTGISSTLSYSYYLVAVATIGGGVDSNTITLQPAGLVTPAPTGVYAIPVNNTVIQVVWNTVPGASSYNVYRGTAPGQEAIAPIATGVTTQYGGNTRFYFQDNGLTTGVPYYYYVTAVSVNGEGGKSAEVEAIPGGTPPAAPVIAGVAGNGEAILTWTAVPGATSYVVFRSDPLNNNYYTAIKQGLTATTYTDTGLTNGVTYDYVVECINKNGQSGGSNTVAVTPGVSAGNPLTAPVLVATGNDGSVTLTWSNVPGATAYVLYRGTTSGGENAMPLNASISVAAGGVTTYTDSAISNYTTYYYKVAAADGFGVGTQSNEASATPPSLGAGDFVLTATPNAISIAVGTEDTVTIGTNIVNGLSTQVTLTVSGVPANVTASFDPSVAGSTGSYLTLAPASNATPGAYTLTITGTSGGLTHTATVVLVIVAAGSQQAMAQLVKPWDGKPLSTASPVKTRRASLLNDIGHLGQVVDPAEVRGWRTALHTGRVGIADAAQMHLWLGEYALAHDEQPGQALAQFRTVRRIVASLPASNRPDSPALLRTLASYDSGFALFYMGAYAEASDAFRALVVSKVPQPGLDRQTCALWWRHSYGCAGYHAERAALGIPEPPRLDPKCGVAALAACLRGLKQPFAEPRLLASCRVTGQGSHMGDLVAAAPKLGVAMNLVVADDKGLTMLPKPVVAYVEHDHFIAVTQADASGVSYLCSDCGAWPGGAVHLTWSQWHKMDATDYGVVTLPGSAWDHKITAVAAYERDQAAGRVLRVASISLGQVLPSVELLTLAAHLHPHVVNPGGSQGCGQTPDGPKCPPGVCCPENDGGPGPDGGGGPSGGDPVNLASGEEEYKPSPDLTVYNPYGPQIIWQRIYGSLRSSAESAYQYSDFGAGWSQNYNVGVYDTSPGGTGTKYVFFPNGSRLSFSAPSVPSATTPTVQCAPQNGARMLVEWDYANGAYDGSFKITFADRTQWVTTGSLGYPYYCSLLSKLVDHSGNAIAFAYAAPVSGSFPLLQTITDPVHGTTLLTVKRANDGTGNIVSVSDTYGRSIYYHSGYYANIAVPNGYPQGHQEVDHVSQVVKTFTATKPDRWMLGYVLSSNREGNEKVQYMGSITVPSPTGTGTSTSQILYDPNTSLVSGTVDGNGNTTDYSYVNANGQPYEAGSFTRVDTYNASDVLEKTYTVSFDNNLSQTGLYTPAAPAPMARQVAHLQIAHNQGVGYPQYTYTYADPNNPYGQSQVTDANGHTTSSTYDQYGNVLTSTSARGTVTTNTYVYTGFALGELMKTQTGAKSPTTYTYYEPSGLVHVISDPLPGTVGSTSVATITYAYNQYGDITSLVDPGNNAVTTSTHTFNFGSIPKLGQPLTVTDQLGHTLSFTYDAQGNNLSQTDGVGNTTNFAYDIANNQTQITYPATVSGGGRAYHLLTYLYPGGPNTVTTDYNESGTAIRKVTDAYGLEGELLSVSGSAEPVTYTYNSVYQKTSIMDGNGHSSHYYFTTAGFLAAVTGPSYAGPAYPNISGKDSLTYTSYDPLGDPLTRVDGNGKTTTYKYNDPENKRTDITYPSGTLGAVHLTYDVYGRLSTTTDGTGTGTTTYDDRNNVLSVATTYTGLAAKTISYTYYPDGSRKTMVTPAGTYTSTYDGAGRQTGLTNPYSEATTWSYYNNNILETQTLGNSSAATVAQTTYTYNTRLFLTDLHTKNASGTTLSEYGSTTSSTNDLQYDGVGNRTHVTASLYSGGTLLGAPYSGTTAFTYDGGQTANPALNRSQLTSEVMGSTTTSYQYDGGATGGPGNVTSIRGKTLAYDTANQISGTGYAYDGNGNPTTYQASALTYDLENRLTAVGTVFTAAYTFLGQRAWKQNATGRTYYLYDGGTLVCELNSSGTVTAANTFGVNGLVSRHIGSTTTFYTWDPQRNVAQTLSSTGTVTNSFHVDAFGNKTSTSATTDPYSGFDGQDGGYTDSETGLTFLMLRYYDSGTGRFLTRDPSSYVGGINIYAYTQNNPVNRIDPTGLDSKPQSCTPPPPNHCQRDYNDCINDASNLGKIAASACLAAALAAGGLCFFSGPAFPVCAAGVIAAEVICLGAAVAAEKYSEYVCNRTLQHCLEDAGS